MPRISADNPVRRRLFAPDNLAEEAKIDNFANLLQESIITDRTEKSKKWNFDFENEVPLDGDYEWHPCHETSKWIGVTKITDANEQDSFLPMKVENEITPRVKETKVSQMRQSLKRRLSIVPEKGIRRKICFE
ncbi:unnamed protein product [Pieris brassicae]|uniref:Cyclin-dependent kinase inhibitor domain-containing protein n=1 Tax=Pieris brassicae TaxID=7116 RepID=A0A9P0T046_PIEBR|nr:unnamed protein product [Pieris brassicae]